MLGKEPGHLTTLPKLLKMHSWELNVEFHVLSDEKKAAILLDHLQVKEKKGNTLKNVSNTALGKILDF